MSGQTPEIVATASLSPVSPSFVHAAPSTDVIHDLQDNAEPLSLDVASLSAATAAVPATMASSSAPQNDAALNDSKVADGPTSDASGESIADDDSFDAYGEDDDSLQQTNEPSVGNDDQTTTNDAPPVPVAATATEPMFTAAPAAAATAESAPRQDASDTSESMNSSSTTESLTNQAPAAPILASALPAPPSHLPASAGLANPGGAFQEPQVASSGLPDADTAASAPAPLVTSNLLASLTEVAGAGNAENNDAAIDIQKLVEGITAGAASTASSDPSSQQLSQSVPQPASYSVSPVQPSSLPPKPSPVAQSTSQLPARPEDFHLYQSHTPKLDAHPAISAMATPTPGAAQAIPRAPYLAAVGAPGTSTDAVSASLPPPPSTSFNGVQPFAPPTHMQPMTVGSPPSGNGRRGDADTRKAWETFQADEKRYTNEAKWEKFPDGSRIFIGNLSSERVSKRQVFDLFHRFGRLAQISLKSAYGFVQYHTVADAQNAMQHAQGAELGGRKIHLEHSRAQKKKDDRDRSPERRNRGGRGADRYDGRESARKGRDDYRPARSPSPRRSDGFGRDRNYSGSHDRNRARSRSPQRSGRYDGDQYRRRSPSPQRSTQADSDHLDIPRRYGDQVPDVQLLLLQEVDREFVAWVQRAFYERGLKSDVMFLNPRFPRDAVLQRQVIEGVHGVIELGARAQSLGKIPLQVFDRSAGINNVRFDQYQDLDPKIAAELVHRTKTQAASQQPQHPQPSYTPTQYGQQYPPPQAAPAGYPYPNPPQAPPAQPAASAQDIASVMGQLDNSTLQALLASLQPGQAGAGAQHPAAHPGAQQSGGPFAQNPQIDINALLGSLNGATTAQPAYGTGNGYPVPGGAPAMSPSAPGSAPGGGADAAQQVQNIMATLARYRQ